MLNRIDAFFVSLACLSLFAVMAIVGIDALGRNLFDQPITGAYVLIEEYLMPAMIFPLIGYVWMIRAHVGISLLRDRMPSAVRRVLRVSDTLFGLLIFGLITYVGWQNTVAAYQGGELTSGLIRWPIWLALVWMPLGGSLFCLRLLSELPGLLLRNAPPPSSGPI